MSLAKPKSFVLPYEPAAIGLRETERARGFKRTLQRYPFRGSSSMVTAAAAEQKKVALPERPVSGC